MLQCCEELYHANFYVAVLFEGLSVAILVFIGCSEVIKVNFTTGAHVPETATAFGISYATLTHCLKDLSGGHLNPAISFACILTRRVSLLRGICYMIFQCGGAILGVFLLKEMTPVAERGNLGLTQLHDDISLATGMGYELIMTFVLAWVFFASHSSKNIFKGFGGPLAVGLSAIVAHLVILRRTGCSLNPARSLGPAVIEEEFHDHWIYWAGPMLAASLAGLLHDLVFRNIRIRHRARPRSCSITCCKKSREETLVEDPRPPDEDYLYRDIIVKKQEEKV